VDVAQEEAVVKRLVSYADVISIIDQLPMMVKEKRRQRGLSLREAAEESGVSFNAISRFERGGITMSDHLRKLLDWVSEVSP
jgi:ribosome-binding protein aMBF1 (putative translation factor)